MKTISNKTQQLSCKLSYNLSYTTPLKYLTSTCMFIFRLRVCSSPEKHYKVLQSTIKVNMTTFLPRHKLRKYKYFKAIYSESLDHLSPYDNLYFTCRDDGEGV